MTRQAEMTARAPEHVLVVGGGFSGTLLAINLLRHGGPRATLVERRPGQVARGVAYSAAHPRHLLNVRAANMSALPDDPGHFVRWLSARGGGEAGEEGAGSFVPRTLYGTYLAEMLAAARAAAPDRLCLVTGEVVSLTEDADGVAARLADGTALAADAAVLAVGNLPPHDPPGLSAAGLPPGTYRPDPWAGDLGEGLGDADEVFLLGTGLTAVDAALLLDAGGFRGRITALSRRGLAPRRHLDGQSPAPGVAERPAGALSRVVRTLRARAAAAGWRGAVDELRPVTTMLWGGMDQTTRARFLRHARPWWDVHRHRLAPEVADRVDAMVADGRLRFAAGRVVSVEPMATTDVPARVEAAKPVATTDAPARAAATDATDDTGPPPAAPRVRLRWRPRGADAAVESHPARLVNCTGPQGDLTRSPEPLLASMLAAGTIRPDALALGLDVDAQGRVMNRDGAASERLSAVGPMTRGGVWEIVAVPDIRRQAAELARRLSNAQWVGGEGL